jgi:hypothetical protein
MVSLDGREFIFKKLHVFREKMKKYFRESRGRLRGRENVTTPSKGFEQINGLDARVEAGRMTATREV